MKRNQRVVTAKRCDHGNTDAKHGQDQRRRQPVQKPHRNRELPALGRSYRVHLRTSEGVTAPGVFFSPARLLNESE